MKLNKAVEYRLTFTHLNGKPATLNVAYNKLTGDWLQAHTIGENSSAYVATKSAVASLIANIIQKSKENRLPCEMVESKNRLT